MKRTVKKSDTHRGESTANLAAFKDGAFIFREGERGDVAYRVVDGQVDLLKNTDAGLVQIERLPAPSLFGETGILDQSRRTVSARAIGDVIVEVIHRDAFLESVRRDPEQALNMMSVIASRASVYAAKAKTSSGMLGNIALVGWLGRFLQRKKPQSLPIIDVRVSNFAGENGDAVTRAVMAGLKQFSELKIRTIPPLDGFSDIEVDDSSVSDWVTEARQALQRSGGDILVWGKAPGAGGATRLRLVSVLPGDEDLPGNLTGFAEVPIASEPSDDDCELLRAAVLAAMAPHTEGTSTVVQIGLTGVVETIKTLVAKPPPSFTPADRIHLLLIGAHILATTVQRAAAPPDTLRNALENYKQALALLPADAPGLSRGLILKNIGASLMVLGEREMDPDCDPLALEAVSAACDLIPRNIAPREWASAHNRLGQLLYRLDLTEPDAEMTHLKRALAAFQAAMQVYTRVEAPERWADAMNNYAQAAQVLGGSLQSPKILQNSVRACRNALEIRHRSRSPQLWASTQNTLGSGLFLLGKIVQRTDILQNAVDAFEAALSVYAESGATKMVDIIERNLHHVHDLIEQLERALQANPESRQVVDADWWKANVVNEKRIRRDTTV